MKIYDLKGRNIATLTEKIYNAGHHKISWNADQYASGVYFIKMISGDFIKTQKLMLVK